MSEEDMQRRIDSLTEDARRRQKKRSLSKGSKAALKPPRSPGMSPKALSGKSRRIIEKRLMAEINHFLEENNLSLESKVEYETVEALFDKLGLVSKRRPESHLLLEMCKSLDYNGEGLILIESLVMVIKILLCQTVDASLKQRKGNGGKESHSSDMNDNSNKIISSAANGVF